MSRVEASVAAKGIYFAKGMCSLSARKVSIVSGFRLGVFAKCKCGLVIHSKSRHPWIPKRSTAASTSRAPPQLFTALSSYPLHVRRFLSRLPYLLFYYHYCSLSILLFSATILFTVSTYSIRACPQQFLHPFLVAVLSSFIGSGHEERHQDLARAPCLEKRGRRVGMLVVCKDFV